MTFSFLATPDFDFMTHFARHIRATINKTPTLIDILKKDIVKYIYYYNNDRFKQKLNGLSPVQYRTQAA